MRLPKFDRAQRLILYGAVTLWFMAYTLSQQRNYQDSWILDGLLVPFVLCLASYLWVVAAESDNRVVAVVTAWTIFIINVIPGLKYVQPYGNALDGTVHYLVTDSLITTGHSIASDEVYASIPGMHSWLASTALAGGFSAAAAIKFVLPLIAVAMPLLVYWLSRQASLPVGPAKFAIATTCLASYTQYEPYGTGFTVAPLVLFLGVLFLRHYQSRPGTERLIYSVVALIGVVQLTIWHSTTPMLLPMILAALSLSPLAIHLVSPGQGGRRLATGFLWMAILVGVAFLAYHVVPGDDIYQVITRTAARFGTGQDAAQEVVPARVFQITLLDLLRVAVLIEGRDIMLLSLTALGAVIIWTRRRAWAAFMPFYVYWLLTALAFGSLIVASLTGLDYARFLVVPVALSPFVAGVALWWLHEHLRGRSLLGRWIGRGAWSAMIVVILGIWTVAFYNFQPLVPKARSVDPSSPDEYVVWLQAVNSAYQQRMLNFAEYHTAPQSRFAVDITGHRQFLRYFGLEEAYARRLYQPLHLQEPVDPTRMDYFLLHWPGPAGGMTEQVEWRSAAKIDQLRQTPGWGVVYDNGQSFVLKLH